jgi:hypothetical protein
MNMDRALKLLAIALTSLALTFTTACGSDSEAEPKDNTEDTTGGDTTGGDTTGGDTTGGDTSGGNGDIGGGGDTSTEAPETIICQKLIECMSAICTSTFDQAACEQSVAQQGATAEQAAQYANSPCEPIQEAQCVDEQTQAACECPEVPQGGCPDGQACNLGLQDGSYVCGNTDGSIPTDAPVCDQQNPCAEGSVCIVTTQGATSGTCLQTCER